MEMETSGNSGVDHLSGHRTQGGSATERQGQRCDRSLTEHHSLRAEAEAPLGLLCCNALSFLPWSLAAPASGCGTVGPHLLCLLWLRPGHAICLLPPTPLVLRPPAHSLPLQFSNTLRILDTLSMFRTGSKRKGGENYQGTALMGFNHILSWWLLFSRLTGL